MSFLGTLFSPKVLNPLLSIFDREARGIIDRIAANIPEDSPLRSETFGRVFDVMRGVAEGVNFGPLSTVVEKLTDYGDALAKDLEEKGKTGDILQGWMNKFSAEAGKRLERANDVEAELAKIKQEFAARMEVLRMIEAASKQLADEKKAAEKKPPTKPLEVGKAVDTFLGDWKDRARRRGYKERRNP